MTYLSEVCSKCGLDSMNCRCENFHPNKIVINLSLEEC